LRTSIYRNALEKNQQPKKEIEANSLGILFMVSECCSAEQVSAKLVIVTAGIERSHNLQILGSCLRVFGSFLSTG
jgi:hypothetical protein